MNRDCVHEIPTETQNKPDLILSVNRANLTLLECIWILSLLFGVSVDYLFRVLSQLGPETMEDAAEDPDYNPEAEQEYPYNADTEGHRTPLTFCIL